MRFLQFLFRVGKYIDKIGTIFLKHIDKLWTMIYHNHIDRYLLIDSRGVRIKWIEELKFSKHYPTGTGF
jgi:lipid A disaccharide synthetase